MRQRVDVVELKETGPNGFRFNVCGTNYWLRYDEGAWRLVDAAGHGDLFESFNEAMHYALDDF